MSAVNSLLSPSIRKTLRQWSDFVLTLPYRGTGRLCPVCGRASRRFRPFGISRRKAAQCLHCGALERHRLVWLYLHTMTDLFDGLPKSVLHIAPESCFVARFKELLGDGYLTADLNSRRAMVRMDITDIRYADRAFDVIYCSHVLEHVLDDRRAMRELFRVLKPGGWAIILVPIHDGPTFEDSSIVVPKERLKAFGQADHVRRYGADYVERLREAGFTVSITTVSDLVDERDADRMGLTTASGQIHCCTR